MDLKITQRQIGDVTILDLNGRIVLGDESALLRRVILDVIAQGRMKILLNMADISKIDSTGIGELTNGYRTMHAAGGTIKMLNLTRRVHNVVQIVKLERTFEPFDDELVALASFNSEPEQPRDLKARAG